MDKPLLYLSNIYRALSTDEEGKEVANGIIRSTFKRLYVHWSWESDCRQEIITAWLGAKYDIRRPRKEILAYASRAAMLAVLEWRRSVLTVIYANKKLTREPISIPLDELYGEDLDRFVEATCLKAPNPERFEEEEGTDEDDIPSPVSVEDIVLPTDIREERLQEYKTIIESMAHGKEMSVIAKDMGISQKTIRRRLHELRTINKLHSRKPAQGEP